MRRSPFACSRVGRLRAVRWLSSARSRKPQSSASSCRYPCPASAPSRPWPFRSPDRTRGRVEVLAASCLQLLEERRNGIASAADACPAETTCTCSAFGEHAIVVVLDLVRPVARASARRSSSTLRIAEHDQPRLDVLGQRALVDGVDAPAAAPGRTRARCVRAQLMTCVVSTLRMPSSWQKPSSSTLIAGRVDVGQLGEVADAHHHFGVGIAAAHVQIAAQAGREAKADRLQDRIDPQRHACAARVVRPSRRGPPSVGGSSGTTTTSQPQSAAASRFVRVDAQHQFGPGRTAGAISAGFRLSIETRCPSSRSARTHVADAAPGLARIAADVDHVGPVGRKLRGHRPESRPATAAGHG